MTQPANEFSGFLTHTPFNRALARIKLGTSGAAMKLRVVLFVGLAWLPLLILSVTSGDISNEKITLGFLQDYAVHARLLLALPLLLIAERTIDFRLGELLVYLRASRLLRDEDRPQVKALVERVRKSTNTVIPELVLLIVAYVVIFLVMRDPPIDVASWYYRSEGDGNVPTSAGWWYGCFSY